jgi:hypothetical protein
MRASACGWGVKFQGAARRDRLLWQTKVARARARVGMRVDAVELGGFD